jgi:Carboxypeptidase regulatory-like domain/TonB dependent receptor
MVRTRQRPIVSCLLLALFFCGMTFRAKAQVANTGSVQGTVLDQSGGAVPDASVTLTNSATAATLGAQTNSSGVFRFPIVPVGRYTLNVSKPGFKSYVQSEFPVEAAAPITINASLAVGQTSQEVTVSAPPTTINTVTASEGNTVTYKQMNDLPLTNRLFTQLVLLEPGVSSSIDQTPGFGSNSSINFSLNGVRADENNVMMDGIRNLDTFGGNAFVTPNLFAVSEFRIENNSYSAVTGRSAGGQVNLISRSGTNQFHGNAFEFFRNDVLNARNFFADSVPENRYNDFGYDVGGPIKKDKLFFFWSEEWRRIIQSGGTRLAIVPTTAERSGDFSALLAGPNPQVITNPVTGVPFPNNVIPRAQLDPNAQLLLKNYFPLPTPGFQNGGFNFVSSLPDFTRWREESLRVDYRITDKLTSYVRLTQDNVTLQNPYGLFGENSLPNVGSSSQVYPIYHIAFNLTYTPSPNFISEFTWGTYRGNDKFLQNGPQSCRCNAPGLNIPELFPLNELNRIPSLYFEQGYAGIVEQWYFHNYSFSMPFESNNTWVHGPHTVQFGIDYTREGKSELANPSNNNTNGSFTFNGQYTGNALTDFLVGRAHNYTETALDPFGNYRWHNIEPYFQDQIKLRPNLTLTAGVRYEYYQPEYELHNFFGSFNPAMYNPSQAPIVNSDGTLVPGTGNPLNGIIVAGQNSPYGRALFPSHKDVFAPRIGIVWDPTNSGKTSIRAGYGIFYDRWGSFSQFGGFNPPFNSSVNIFNTFLSNPGGIPGTLYPAGLNAAQPPWNYPQVQKWSFSVQRDLGFNTALNVAYVGTKGTHLLGAVNLNQPFPNPAVANGSISPDAVRPYPGFSTITGYESRFDSNYHALQVSANHRLSHGLAFQASYTYSKALTDSSSAWNTPQDSRNIRLDKGLASYDVPQVLTFNYIWEIPAFQNSKGLTHAVLGGWEASGITNIQSGFPFTVFLPTDNEGIGGGLERPNLIGDPNGPKTLYRWFNTGAFVTPPVATFGNAPNGAVRGPGTINWDFSLSKQFNIRESMNLRFRSEFFNIFNHPSFNNIDVGLGDVSFGQVTGALSPRLIQFSLELSF